MTGNELHRCLEQVIAIDQRRPVRRNAVIKHCLNPNEVNAIIHKDGKKKEEKDMECFRKLMQVRRKRRITISTLNDHEIKETGRLTRYLTLGDHLMDMLSSLCRPH